MILQIHPKQVITKHLDGEMSRSSQLLWRHDIVEVSLMSVSRRFSTGIVTAGCHNHKARPKPARKGFRSPRPGEQIAQQLVTASK